MTLNRKGLALKAVGDSPPDVYLDATGNLVIVEDAEAVGQHVEQRLKFFHGEWFLDRDAGVTWLTEVLGFDYDPVLAEALTKAEILETDGVTEIESFSVRFDQATRGLSSYNITILTDYDERVSI
jgi:hypothetical protein